MKTDIPIEFQIVFSNAADPDGRISRNFIFPTAPAYFNANTYNQKCMVEFLSISTDGDITAGNESTIFIQFEGIKSNQFRLAKTLTANGLNLASQSFIPTPLQLNYTTHAGGVNLNAGNVSMGTSNPIICDNVWGKSVEIKVYELENSGSTAATNFSPILSNTIVNIVMRITPFTEDCGC